MQVKKRQLILCILFLLFSSIAIAETCGVHQVKTTLIKSLYSYLTEPNSLLPLDQIKDLLIFYLALDEGAIAANCSQEGYYSDMTITEIINSLEIQTVPITCRDGTPFGECADEKPKYCYLGNLVDRCSICGCDNESCDIVGGECQDIGVPIECNVDSNCGEDGFYGEYGCKGNNITRDYFIFTCNYPNTIESDCVNETTPIPTEICPIGCSNGECVDEVCRTIDQPGEYIMTADIINNDLTEDCIKITAPNVIFDCDGYSISSENFVSGIYSNSINTEIKNCNVSMGRGGGPNPMGNGIKLENADGSYIHDNILNNQHFGLVLFSTSGTTIKKITSDGNYQNIALFSSSLNVITDVTVTGGSNGIYFHKSDQNTINESTVQSNGIGIYIDKDASDTNIVRNNIITGNSNDGIRLREGDYTTIKDNLINDNFGGDGLDFDATTGTIVIGNTICNPAGQSDIDCNSDSSSGTTNICTSKDKCSSNPNICSRGTC